MKKVYEKPQVLVENFELSQYIASCAVVVNSGDTTSCSADYEVGGLVLKLFAVTGTCDVLAENFCTYNMGDDNSAGGTFSSY